ncbi:MAG: chlorohydrolase, partial [Clostridia bacterium]|nr:chlorohydrolase [Clostridia bacterium]
MLLIGNGRLVTRDNGYYIENGAVALEDNLILDVGETAALKERYPQAEFIDANGGLIMPGLINTHNHIYSAFARGLSINGYSPRDFNDILEGMWWKIDRLLTKENDSLSAYAVYIDCIKNGVTTVFDHHASYFDIPGSLDTLADAAKELGVRTSLCYEVSDRDGEAKMKEAVLENARMIRRAEADQSDMLKGMMGLHAAFTLSDETLALCKAHTPETTGFHVHVAEGPGDQVDSLKKYGKRIVERLWEQGILGERTLAIHCVHVS